MNILFLDFDGVLHPEGVGAELDFCHMPNFEALMLDFPHVHIVVSSTWRLTMDMAALVSCFPESLRSRVAGVTPDLPSLFDQRGHRQRECEQWLLLNAASARWLAIDDRSAYFDEDCPHVVILPHVREGGTGLEGAALGMVRARMTAAFGASPARE